MKNENVGRNEVTEAYLKSSLEFTSKMYAEDPKSLDSSFDTCEDNDYQFVASRIMYELGGVKTVTTMREIKALDVLKGRESIIENVVDVLVGSDKLMEIYDSKWNVVGYVDGHSLLKLIDAINAE